MYTLTLYFVCLRNSNAAGDCSCFTRMMAPPDDLIFNRLSAYGGVFPLSIVKITR